MKKNILIVLVTGGASGLGRKISEYFYNNGNHVYVFDKISRYQIENEFIASLSGYIECDLSNTEKLITCFKNLILETQKIDILINNASVRKFKYLDNFSTAEIETSINVDFLCPVLLTRICLPVMKMNNYGRIINISSISALQGYSQGGLYCSSKHALITLTESLSRELRDLNGAITINAICPESFSNVNGVELKNYDSIINSILASIEIFVQTSKNGKIIHIFSIKNKIIESLRYFTRAFKLYST